MAKFKRLNIYGEAARAGVSYNSIDFLRQTAIKEFVERNKKFDAEQMKNILLNNITVLLNKMIVDEGGKYEK